MKQRPRLITNRNTKAERRAKTKEFAVIESMTKILWIGHWVIRVWRTEEELRAWYNNEDLRIAVYNYFTDKVKNNDLDRGELAALLARMPRVAAVEVKDTEGNGLVIYKEWP